MTLTPHFTVEELTVSQWAARNGVDNTPGPAELANLKRLAQALEVVRYTLGAPVTVTSGYRSQVVNRMIGGVSSSAHTLGLAADFICPKFGTPLDVAKKLMGVEALLFDQLIHEYGRWVHIGLAVEGKTPRLQALTIFTPGKYLAGLLSEQEATK
jgi:hypothetical protein